jgi:hypothetical protein
LFESALAPSTRAQRSPSKRVDFANLGRLERAALFFFDDDIGWLRTRFRFENESPSGMADTNRKAITLASATWVYLEELSKLGTHGTTAPGVAATLVEIGVREAIEKGYLKLRGADDESAVS